MAIVPFKAFADSFRGGIVERRVQCAQSRMHLVMPAPNGALSDDACLTSDVCLSRTSGLSQEQRGVGRPKFAHR